jgi:hypothetical protein
MPCLFVFLAGSAWAIKAAPDFFVSRNGHLLLVGFQGVTLLIYLATLIRAFTNITPLISATRAEWRDDVEEGI